MGCTQLHARHRDDRNAADLEAALRAAEAAVKKKLGCTIALTEKPLFDYSSAIPAGTMEATVSAAHSRMYARGEAGLNLGDSVDEGAMTGDGARADEQMGEDGEEDEVEDDDLEPEELGRRMHARGDAPPSPYAQNDRIRRGYDEAAQAATADTGAANSPAAEPSSAAMRFTVGSSFLRGDEMSQDEIDQARAKRQRRQQTKGKQRASASVAGGPPAKKPR